jgi:hypothetical protein
MAIDLQRSAEAPGDLNGTRRESLTNLRNLPYAFFLGKILPLREIGFGT